MAAFAGYCEAYSRWKEAEDFISKHGTIVKTPSGYWQQVPQVFIAQTYFKIMIKFCEQFGLTPSSRSRIVVDKSNNNTAYVEISKKNGKSELAAAVALLMTCGYNGWGAEVYYCASDRQQASIVFDVAVEMVEQSSALKKEK